MVIYLYKVKLESKCKEYVMTDEIVDDANWELIKEDIWLTEQACLERLGVARFELRGNQDERV